jgi:hypothetical protein
LRGKVRLVFERIFRISETDVRLFRADISIVSGVRWYRIGTEEGTNEVGGKPVGLAHPVLDSGEDSQESFVFESRECVLCQVVKGRYISSISTDIRGESLERSSSRFAPLLKVSHFLQSFFFVVVQILQVPRYVNDFVDENEKRLASCRDRVGASRVDVAC